MKRSPVTAATSYSSVVIRCARSCAGTHLRYAPGEAQNPSSHQTGAGNRGDVPRRPPACRPGESARSEKPQMRRLSSGIDVVALLWANEATRSRRVTDGFGGVATRLSGGRYIVRRFRLSPPCRTGDRCRVWLRSSGTCYRRFFGLYTLAMRAVEAHPKFSK